MILLFQLEINNFREAFERGDDPLVDMTDASDINSVAGVLKLYLRELREPVFSVQYFDQFMELASKRNNEWLFIIRKKIKLSRREMIPFSRNLSTATNIFC